MPLPKLVFFRDELRLTTWLLLGACLQSLLFLLLPPYVAALSPAVLLAPRVTETLLKSNKVTSNTSLKDVLQGRYTAQVPAGDRSAPQKGSDAEVVLFIVGARSNHPLGRFAPGFKELARYFQSMWKEADRNREEWGYLGKSSALLGTELEAGNEIITMSYWKNIESLHAFAQGPAHRAGWDWWNSIVKEHPYIGIMHEVYAAPVSHWENIYVNFQPFGMGQTKISTDEQPDGKRILKSTLVKARDIRWKSMLGRMNRE